MQAQLQQGLEKLQNLPLTKTTRNELVQYFHFGNAKYTTPQGLVLDIGAYTLAVNCPWQLQLPDGDTIKHNEVFMRKREAGMPALKFDWKVPGANLRDQRLKDVVQSPRPLVIERAELTADHGLTIYFNHGRQLTITPDTSKATEEYWQLFSNTGDNYKIGAGPGGLS